MTLVLDAQVGVLQRPFNASVEPDVEHIRQAEVFAADSPLVVQRGLVGGEQAATAADVLSQLPALRVRQRGDVRKYEQLEFVDVGRVQQAVVRHLKRDA